MTDRLSPADAAFLYAEEQATPRTVGGVVIIKPKGVFDFQRIVDVVDQRLNQLPRYRQIVRMVPGSLARPVWIDDTDFDLSYHIRRSSLPKPGSSQQLDELVGRLITRPLDRNRPLWELYIVEGLSGGRVALVNKTHEALVNRVGAVDVAAVVLDDTARAPSQSPAPWIAGPEPSNADLVVDAVTNVVARPTDVADTARLWTLNARAIAASAVDTGLAVADVLRRSIQPSTRPALAVPLPGPRLFAATDMDLAEIKAIRHAHGSTVNDVILAIISGAVRSWLLSRGNPVTNDTALKALAPMSVRPDDDDDDSASVVSRMIDLPVAEGNAVMRLHQVSFQMRSHTESGRQVGADSLLTLGRFAPATLHAMGARAASQLSRRSYDLLVTNVPGPQHRLYAAGHPVDAMYPVVPLVKGHAIGVGCTSYRGRVYVGLTADQEAMPDVAEFARLIREALTELAQTAPGNSMGGSSAGDTRAGD